MFYAQRAGKKHYFPEVDAGGHKHFRGMTVPDSPAPVKTISRQGPDSYAARVAGETSYWSTFRQALIALYPELRT